MPVAGLCVDCLQFEAQQVSRFLVSLGASGLPVTLALNKADLLPASEVEARLAQVAGWGYRALAVSCETGQGLDQLAQALQGGGFGVQQACAQGFLMGFYRQFDMPPAVRQARAWTSWLRRCKMGLWV